MEASGEKRGQRGKKGVAKGKEWQFFFFFFFGSVLALLAGQVDGHFTMREGIGTGTGRWRWNIPWIHMHTDTSSFTSSYCILSRIYCSIVYNLKYGFTLRFPVDIFFPLVSGISLSRLPQIGADCERVAKSPLRNNPSDRQSKLFRTPILPISQYTLFFNSLLAANARP